MAYPTPYNRQNSFTLLAQEDPSEPYTGADLDEEFNSLKVTIDSLIERLRLIQRADGRLENGVVALDSLGFEFALGIDAPVAWETATAYTTTSTVFNGVKLYRANVAHTSAALFATDAAKWDELADLTDMLAEGIGTAELEDESVTTVKLGPSAVTNPKLATNAVATSNIQDNAVTTAKILASNVTTAKILDANVTYAKIQNVAANSVLGSIAGGAPAEISATAIGRGVMAAATQAALTALLAAGTAVLPGILELATDAEGITGTDTARAVTPANLAAVLTDRVAAQSDQETATSTTKVVTAGRQHFHPSAAKCWVVATGTGTPAIQVSRNITSITDNGNGNLTVTIATDFSGAYWACVASTELVDSTPDAGDDSRKTFIADLLAGSVRLLANDDSVGLSLTDPLTWHMVGFGDHA